MSAKDTDDLAVTSDLARGGSAHMIWNLRIQGFSVHEISQQVGLPPVEVDELLMKHHTERQACPTEANDFYRHIAVSRVESLLKTYLPIALMKEVILERIRSGEPVPEGDVVHPLHCAAFCLAALKFQAELLGLRNPEPARIAGAGAQEVLSWLRTQTEFINQVVREAPRDVVVLPTEQLDGAQSPATQMKTPGSQTDRAKLASEELELDVDLNEIEIPVAGAPITETLRGGLSGPVEDPLEAGRREYREPFFRGECDAL